MVLLLACAGDADDSVPTELPPEESATDPAPDSFRVDTALDDTGGDVAPEHSLTITHTGEWLLSPSGGPWTAMTGTLDVGEVLDGDLDDPSCAVSYALTGAEADESCDDCVATFVVHHYLAEGELESCRDPDLPADAEERVLGWSDADGVIRYDVGGAGVWVDWYAGERVGDTVSFTWETTVGVAVEDEDG